MYGRRLFLAAIGATVLLAGSANSLAGCPPITQSQEKALLRYVRAKYRLSADLPLRMLKEGTVGKTCYERIRFVSNDPARYFNYAVVVLPDHVYFAREVMDSSTDPLAEERERKRSIQERLLSGTPPSKGPAAAPVTVVVFSDFQCPYCAQAARTMEQTVQGQARVRLVFRHFPLPFHKWALPAAKAAVCVNAQSTDAFWKLHDYYFQSQSVLNPENVAEKSLEFVPTLRGLNLAAYKSCIESDSTQAIITRDMELGRALEVRGTPTIFVNGQRIAGAAQLPQATREFAPETAQKK